MGRGDMPHNDREQYEALHEALLGALEELVDEAEDLAAGASGRLVEEGEHGAQLWEEVKERYHAAQRELTLREGSIDEILLVTLQSGLDELKHRAEAAYGATLE